MSKLKLQNLVLIPVGGFDKQYAQSFEDTRITEELEQIIQIAGETGEAIPVETILPALESSVVFGSSTRKVEIPNGWEDKRYAFNLTAEQVMHGRVFTFHLSGYTDYAGVVNGQVDPHLRFHVNKVMTTLDDECIACDHLLVDSPLNHSTANSGSLLSMRPVDVLNTLELKDLPLAPPVFDARSSLTSGVKLSSCFDGERGRYLQRLMGSMLEYKPEMDVNDTDLYYSRLIGAMELLRENNVYDNPVLYQLTGETDFDKTGSFAYQDLQAIFSDLPENTQIITQEETPDEGFYSSWASNSLSRRVAYELAHSLIARLSAKQVVSMTFYGESVDGGEINLDLVELGGGVTVNPTNDLTEILKGLVKTYDAALSVRVSGDLLTELVIYISLNRNPIESYRFPSFASGLLSPMMTNDKAVLDHMADDVESLYRSLS